MRRVLGPFERRHRARGVDLKDQDLRSGVGDVAARAPSSTDPRIDGLAPSLVFEPEDEEACAGALALCHQESMAVVPVGGATRLELGNPPSRLDAYLVMAGLSGVEDHIPGDLTVAVRAGTTLAELQQRLAETNQFLPIDAPKPDQATLGGIFAAGEPGLRRRPGARARDLLLGLEGILADGTRFKAGGRVVKNVAGYELMKLFVGSAGTLAVMTRAFLRLRALPEDERTIVLRAGRAWEAERVWRELRGLSQPPEIAALLSPETSERFGLEDWSLLLLFEGLAEEVRGGASEAGGESVASPPWDEIRDFPIEGELVLRGMVAPSRTFQLAESWQDGGELVAFPDSGLVYSRTKDPEALADRLERAQTHGAGVVLERASSAIKQDIDVYGETPGGFDLMKRIKERLDPKGILSPGRFVGRL